MQFLFRPESGTEKHFSASSIEAAQNYAAAEFAGVPGIIWRIDFVATTGDSVATRRPVGKSS